MEKAVTERPISQEVQINQRQTWHNGSVATGDTKCQEDPSQSWYARRQTGWSRTHIPSGRCGGNTLPQDNGQRPVCQRPVCRDFLRGRCTRGTHCKYQHCEPGEQNGSAFLLCLDFVRGQCTFGESCKFRHSESDKNDGNRSYCNENLGNFANSGISQFGEGNTDDNLRSSFPRDHRSSAPCWKFPSGRCLRGAACPFSHSENTYVEPWSTNLQQGVATTARNPGFGEGNIEISAKTPQEYDEANKGNDRNARPFFGGYRSRSPCRNFLRGRCYNGSTCPRLHTENTAYVRPRYEWSSRHHQEVVESSVNPGFDKGSIDLSLRTSQEHDEINKGFRTSSFHREPRSRSPCRKFLRGICFRGASCPYMHQVMYGTPKNDYSTEQHQGTAATSSNDIHGVQPWQDKPAGSNYVKDARQSTFNTENMDLTSRSWSSERQRSRTHDELGSDKPRKEFCLKFSKGRCDRGDSCRYLHSFHEYAKSIPDSSKEPFSEVIAASSSFDGTNQHAPSMTCQGQDHVGSGLCSSENMHTGNGSVSQNGTPDQNRKRQSSDDTLNPNALDQKGEARVMDVQNYEDSGGVIANNSNLAEADNDISLWSPPFKRRRSRSGSPFTPRNDFSHRSVRRDEFHNNFSRDRHYKVVPFRYAYRSSYHHYRSRYHLDNPSHSKVAATSVNSPSREVSKDSNSMKSDVLDKAVNSGMQLDQCAGGTLDSNTEILNKKSEYELAKGAVQPSNVEKDDTESEVTAPLRHDKVMSNGMHLDQCGAGNLDSNNAILSHKIEVECAQDDVETSNVKKDGEGLVGSSEIDVSKGQSAVSAENVEFDSASSSEDDTSPMDTDVSVLSEDNDGEVNNNLSPEGGETSEALKAYSRKRRIRKRSKSHAEPLKEEVTEPAKQGPSSSCNGETSLSCPNIVSVIGVSNNTKITVEISSAQQLEQENREIINKIQSNIEPVPSVMEDGTMAGGDSDSHFMETSGSSSKEAKLNFKGKLLILDVNGLLADIVADYPERFKPDTVVSMKAVFKRPFCDDFLKFCFERFDVGVWSSRTKKNVDRVIDFLMGDTKKRLLFCWDQSHCTDTGYKTIENKDKPLVLKELQKLWERQEEDLPWEKGYYNETNTILLDDSPYKALRNPPYTAVFPYPYSFRDVRDRALGPGGSLRLYLEKLSAAENVQKFIQENPFGQRPITKTNLSWGFYSKIANAYSTQNEGNANNTPAAS